jgi:hypothetical protein
VRAAFNGWGAGQCRLLVVLLAILFTGHASGEDAMQDWGFLKFAEVKAYRTNWRDEYSRDLIVNDRGRLNPARYPKEGIPLGASQVNQLRKAVTGSHKPHNRAYCFNPHHAFVFYDASGKIVGNIDICFSCLNYHAVPKGFAEDWDLRALKKLFEELGIPIKNPAWKK